MTNTELLEAAKLRVRKATSDNLDKDINLLIDMSLTDLKRIGVHASWLEAPSDPMIIEAVLSYVKANYGIDDNYDTLIGIYNMILTKIKGDCKYFKEAPVPPEPDPEPDPEPEPDPDPVDPDPITPGGD